jgi:hypothetical protein
VNRGRGNLVTDSLLSLKLNVQPIKIEGNNNQGWLCHPHQQEMILSFRLYIRRIESLDSEKQKEIYEWNKTICSLLIIWNVSTSAKDPISMWFELVYLVNDCRVSLNQ